jgi:hypothetical protein
MSSFRLRVPLHHIDTSHPPDDDELHDPIDSVAHTPRRSSSHQTIPDVQHERVSEKDMESAMMRRSRTRSLCTTPAEERPWKNDIVTFDSKDDPQNPKNWSYRRKAFVTMLFGLTTS